MPKDLVFFGTPYVASETLDYLVEHGYVPRLVVTSPDAPKGRGLVLTPSATKERALALGIPVLTPHKLTPEAIGEISAYACPYAVVVAYGKILPQSLIDSFPNGVLNVHYSLLPKYRGASPVEAALLAGDAVTGVSIQRMVYELDAGDIIAAIEEPIEKEDTTLTLRPRLIRLGSELLLSVLPSVENGTATYAPQDHTLATHSGKFAKADGELQIPGNDTENWRKYRAFAESPGTFFYADRGGRQVRVKITNARLAGGTFVIERVVPEGKREMAYEEFLRSA